MKPRQRHPSVLNTRGIKPDLPRNISSCLSTIEHSIIISIHAIVGNVQWNVTIRWMCVSTPQDAFCISVILLIDYKESPHRWHFFLPNKRCLLPQSAFWEKDSLSYMERTDSFADWCSNRCCRSHRWHTGSSLKVHIHSVSVQVQTAFYFTNFLPQFLSSNSIVSHLINKCRNLWFKVTQMKLILDLSWIISPFLF